MKLSFLTILFLVACATTASQEFQIPIKAPGYIDPLWHGGADPTVLWNPYKKKFYMYYTQRRADLQGEGWAEGTKIGIAASGNGQQWMYVGVCRGERLERPVEDDYSLWAPSVIYYKKKFHMYVSYVPGITGNMGKGIRYIKHYTGKDGENWNFESFIALSSDRCIDPCVYKIGNTWVMAYKDEKNGSHTWLAESKDLYKWKVKGAAIEDVRHEAPFYWQQNSRHFMMVDAWKLQARVYESPDGLNNWKYITSFPAGHPAVLTAANKTYLIHHTHDSVQTRRTAIFIKPLIIGTDGNPVPVLSK